jgi:signal transduction histidine kinase
LRIRIPFENPSTATFASVGAIITVGILSLLLLVYSDSSWREDFQEHVSLQDNIMIARTTVAHGIRWAERAHSGDETIPREMVTGLFDRAILAVAAAEDGVSDIAGLPGLQVGNEELMGGLANYRSSIQQARDIAEEWLGHRQDEDIENDAAARFDTALQEAGLAASVIDFMINRSISSAVNARRTVHALTITVWAVFLAGISVLFFVVGRKRDRAEKEVRRLSRQLITAQELERQRLSHDLHDNLAQDLAHLKIQIHNLRSGLPAADPGIEKELVGFSRMVEKALRTVREIAYGLRPAGMDQLGLVQVASQHCEELSSGNGLKVDFMSVGMENLRLDADTAITLYRILQEGLNNVVKHAGATQAKVRLVASFPNILLRIEDNGRGFDVQERLRASLDSKRMGIRGMKERIAFLEGTLKITSRPGRGARILAEVPCKEEDYGKGKARTDRG